ncbi:MAG: ACP S-malonyltransferase, partial [Stellaceae bacterium]
VSAPFHCALMAPAAHEMADALDEIAIVPPVVPVVANVTAAPVSDPVEIRRLLVEQVTSLVRWRECVLAMTARGVTELVEIGAGKVLTSLAKRIDRELAASAVGTPADIKAFVKAR